MKILLGPALLLTLGLAVQDPGAAPPKPENYPGQSSHAHPPPGWECRDKPLPGEHECHCKRMTGTDDPLCENEPDPRECEVWCYAKRHFDYDQKGRLDPITGQRGRWHASHCKCPITCEVGK